MIEFLKKFVLFLITVAAIIVIGYAAYKLYNAAMDDASNRIRTGVSQGINDGIGKSLNPIGLIGGVLGGKR